MTPPLHGARYAIIGSGSPMPQILAMHEKLAPMKACKTNSGWDHNPTVKIYKLIEVS